MIAMIFSDEYPNLDESCITSHPCYSLMDTGHLRTHIVMVIHVPCLIASVY